MMNQLQTLQCCFGIRQKSQHQSDGVGDQDMVLWAAVHRLNALLNVFIFVSRLAL